jgi:predicted TIM-barrel fold metal-dependent hydrolase
LSTNRIGSVEELVDIETLTPEYFCNADYWPRMSIAAMIFSGVFERHPNLRVGAVEFEVAWAAHFIERMDYIYSKRAYPSRWHHFGNGMLPSGYFHQNVFLSFQEDALGVRLRDVIGLDTLMWGSDYPHPESTFPRTQEILQEVLKECPLEEKGKIVGGNAARVYSNVFS